MKVNKNHTTKATTVKSAAVRKQITTAPNVRAMFPFVICLSDRLI